MSNKIFAKKCMAALLGIFLVGAGVAFNAGAGLGNDPVGIFYDGIRCMLHLSSVQLGMASNVVNVAIMIFLVFAGRRYVNIGTFIYIVPYGLFVNLGTWLYNTLFAFEGFLYQLAGVVVGCLCICLGVAIFIVADIGVDPLTGLALWIGDKLHWEYRKAKVLLDICLTVIGYVMGGKLGVVTIVTMFLCGPTIQFFSDKVRKLFQNEKVRRSVAKAEA